MACLNIKQLLIVEINLLWSGICKTNATFRTASMCLDLTLVACDLTQKQILFTGTILWCRQGSKFVVAMFSHLLPGCSCGSKHLLLPKILGIVNLVHAFLCNVCNAISYTT